MQLIRISVFLAICHIVCGCNRIYCASVISNCLIDPSCEDGNNGKEESCRQSFADCMGIFFDDCCNCNDMCPKGRSKRRVTERTKSSVAILGLGLPEMFKELTDSWDKTWESFTFPIDYDVGSRKPKLVEQFNYYLSRYLIHFIVVRVNVLLSFFTGNKREHESHIVPVNCTVIYMNKCLSYNKCKDSCLKIGAGSFRWFNDACCECVSPDCIIEYGLNQSQCSQCPPRYEEQRKYDIYDDNVYYEEDSNYMDFKGFKSQPFY